MIKADALGGAAFRLATMWRDGRIFYKLTIDGYPQQLSAPRNGASAAITVLLQNRDGFTLHEKRIELRAMVLLQDAGGPGGFDWASDEYLDRRTYEDAASWDIIWSGF